MITSYYDIRYLVDWMIDNEGEPAAEWADRWLEQLSPVKDVDPLKAMKAYRAFYDAKRTEFDIIDVPLTYTSRLGKRPFLIDPLAVDVLSADIAPIVYHLNILSDDVRNYRRSFGTFNVSDLLDYSVIFARDYQRLIRRLANYVLKEATYVRPECTLRLRKLGYDVDFSADTRVLVVTTRTFTCRCFIPRQ